MRQARNKPLCERSAYGPAARIQKLLDQAERGSDSLEIIGRDPARGRSARHWLRERSDWTIVRPLFETGQIEEFPPSGSLRGSP